MGLDLLHRPAPDRESGESAVGEADDDAAAVLRVGVAPHQKLRYGDLGRALEMRECDDLSGLYTGTALKPATAA